MIEKTTKFIKSGQAPGSTMILGEHAVLYGGSCIVAALPFFVVVESYQLAEPVLFIDSGLDNYFSFISDLKNDNRFSFVLAVVDDFLKKTKKDNSTGLFLKIKSSIPQNKGLGSSAAVVVATLRALTANSTDWEIFLTARKIIRKVQGLASGADALASTFGGVFEYKPEIWYRRLDFLNFPISLIYSGKKIPTAEILKKVSQDFKKEKNKYNLIFRKIDKTAKKGVLAWKKKDKKKIEHCLIMHHKQMQLLSLTNLEIEKIVDGSYLPAKISGSGLGDCVLVAGILKDYFEKEVVLKNFLL